MTEGDAMVDLFTRYAKAFETLEPEAILSYYHEPCLLIAPQGVLAFPSRTELSRFFGGLMAGLRRDGYAGSRFSSLKGLVLGETLAMVNGAGVWMKRDGSELRRFGFTYSFQLTGSEWRIVVAAVHDPDKGLSLGGLPS